MNTEADELAALLLNLAAEHLTAEPPDIRPTRFAIDGATAAAHTLGYGPIPFMTAVTVTNYVRAHPRPDHGEPGFYGAYQSWLALGIAAITPTLRYLKR